MFGFLKGLIGTKSDKDMKALIPFFTEVEEIYSVIQQLSNDELRAKTVEFRQHIADAIQDEQAEMERLREEANNLNVEAVSDREKIWQTVDKIEKEAYEKTQNVLREILPEAFAVIKDTARRFSGWDWKGYKTTDKHSKREYYREKIDEWEYDPDMPTPTGDSPVKEIVVTANDFDRELAATKDFVRIEGDKAIYTNQWEAGGSSIRWNMVHYNVQLIGGVVLHEGKIAEMATGEGKTLVATLPVYLNALSGKGVHLVTVNDYLAKRDSEWMGVLFQFHGLSVDCIDKHRPNSAERRRAYAADITYGTNNEFGFDYLRDNMTGDPEEMVQRKLNYAIVDEVDSVLIDEARTPLIISGPTAKGDEQEFDNYKPIVEKLYRVQRDLVNKYLTEAKSLLKEGSENEDGKKGGEQLLRAHHGLPKTKSLIKFLSEPGMRSLMQKTENFYLQNQAKEMHIINDELYFVIDEKNNSIELTEKGIGFVNDLVNDPDFYHLPDVGSEVAEIEKSDISDAEKTEHKSKLMQDFSTKSDRVHSVNQLLRAYAMFEKDVEYVIIDNKVKIVDEKTGRIMEGRRYSDGLHQAIEAKENVQVEAATQTYATITLQNYFRMYNKLAGMTGTASTEAGEFWNIYKLDVVVIPTNRPIDRKDREDMVYKTAREKYNAVIDEIERMVNAGRPVLVGTTSVENSELLSRMLTRKGLKHNVLNAKMHQREAEIVAEAGQARAITIATNMAGRGTDIKLGPGVKDAGGLAIIGTERHDSRRVDRQLRGRSGRQGDPGSSQFFVSLEDDLMRMFGSERIAGIMDRLGLKEGEMIQHSMITKSIERAQKKVEENNFGIRKRLLDYDNVMNSQRDVIYKRRQHALFGERLALDVQNMIYDVCSVIVQENYKNRDFEGFKYELLSVLAIESPFDEQEFLDGKMDNLSEQLYDTVYQTYMKKRNSIADRAYPLVSHVFENQKQYENILIPFSDGKRQYPVIANLARTYENKLEIPMAMEKNISLSVIDNAWKEHLREMDDLRQSVQNATYEQKDPLIIYKLESFGLFKSMIQEVNKNIATFILRCDIPNIQAAGTAPVRQINRAQAKLERKDMLTQAHSDTQAHQRPNQPVKVEKTVGRNDPCPCGSGKKFKHCHGQG